LLQHETIVKGKNFEAAWRKYQSEFWGEDQSRLLAVLFQSGQDFEFGSVAFKVITDRAPKMKTRGILDDFMSDSALELEGYTNHGIFNGLKGNFAYRASTNFALHGVSTDYQPISIDADQLEDLYIQQVLELSKKDTTAGNAREATLLDSSVSRALLASKAMNNTSKVGKDEALPNHTEDDQLKLAIELSLQESRPVAVPAMSCGVEVLDLTRVSSTTTVSRISQIAMGDDAKPAAREMTDSIEEKRRLAAEAAARRLGPY
jgi:hypothetical protein